MNERNCLSYWLPKFQDARLPTPRTQIVETAVDLLQILDGKKPDGFDDFVAMLKDSGDEMGWPIFLRAGQGSGKHEWKNTCCVAEPDDLPTHVYNLVEWSCMFLGLPCNVWAVRELLQLESSFTAFRGFPVNKERRYFVKNGEIVCKHFYWPTKAVEEGRPKDPDWREKLQRLNETSAEDEAELEHLAVRASQALSGAWSVDFAKDKSGKWWLLDAALAGCSFHWEGCEHANDFPRE